MFKKNKSKKKILIATPEMYPFAKTGGLADVCGALPKVLKRLGHDVRVVMPRYWQIDIEANNLKLVLAPMGVQMGNCLVWCAVYMGYVEDIPVYFIDHEVFFGRTGLYDDGNHAYADNPARFAFFSRACVQLCRDIDFQPGIIHCNDWQTALIPAYLKIWERNDSFFAHTASIFAIHNIGYQGIFPRECYDFLGLGYENFTSDKFESYGGVHFMKGGIFYADCISTVSPTHAKEITEAIGSNGLSPYIKRRADDLYGILNGVDYDEWDPQKDTLIPAQYSSNNMVGKKECKFALQQSFGLKQNYYIPVVAVMARFCRQKGFDLIKPIVHDVVNNMNVQLVFVGTGDRDLESYFGDLPKYYPGKIGAYIGYTEQKAHLVEAGSDFFLMPSLYEPCGLNQIYSLKYGTIPIVRDTGGLKDTVDHYSENDGSGTGFKFVNIDKQELYSTIGLAVSTFYDRHKHIHKMRDVSMRKQFSWHDAAVAYEALYDRAFERRMQWAV